MSTRQRGGRVEHLKHGGGSDWSPSGPPYRVAHIRAGASCVLRHPSAADRLPSPVCRSFSLAGFFPLVTAAATVAARRHFTSAFPPPASLLLPPSSSRSSAIGPPGPPPVRGYVPVPRFVLCPACQPAAGSRPPLFCSVVLLVPLIFLASRFLFACPGVFVRFDCLPRSSL